MSESLRVSIPLKLITDMAFFHESDTLDVSECCEIDDLFSDLFHRSEEFLSQRQSQQDNARSEIVEAEDTKVRDTAAKHLGRTDPRMQRKDTPRLPLYLGVIGRYEGDMRQRTIKVPGEQKQRNKKRGQASRQRHNSKKLR